MNERYIFDCERVKYSPILMENIETLTRSEPTRTLMKTSQNKGVIIPTESALFRIPRQQNIPVPFTLCLPSVQTQNINLNPDCDAN